jgi:hypothetical protein
MKAPPCLLASLFFAGAIAAPATGAPAPGLWGHDNTVAVWMVQFDAGKRGPEERARLLERLGFRRFAYDWRQREIPTFGSEIAALQKHGVDLFAWWFFLDADNPVAKATLEVFQRRQVHPRLWVSLFPTGITNLLPPPVGPNPAMKEWGELSAREKEEKGKLFARAWAEDVATTPAAQRKRVQQEANRVYALVRLAAPYGCRVELYNHDGWFGREENQLAILARLAEMGVTDVGMVYNFNHARDRNHDDTAGFPALWDKVKAHVSVVNLAGVGRPFQVLYPSQGDAELKMMKTIQDSGWHGRVGLLGENSGDSEATLRADLAGLDWLAAELAQPGSGGPRPFPAAP